jgi:hypothetical protein
MKKMRLAVIGTAALIWAGCADLPSFPDNFGQGGSDTMTGSSAGSGTVIPNAGSTSTSTSGSGGSGPVSTAGSNSGGSDTGGSATTAGTTSGGTTSGGTDTGMSGSGGMTVNPQAEIDDAVKNLKGWRYENACGYVDGHDLSTCSSGEVCFPNSQKVRFAEKKVIQIGGVVGHQYDVTLRVRGAIEPRDYPADCVYLPGGSPEQKTISIVENCNGFSNTGNVQFNIWELAIVEPKHVYYLNSVKVHPPHRVDAIDQNFTIRVAGGTQINFQFDDINGGEIRNCSITVPGVVPYPKIFDGNFVQLDVVDAKLAAP